MALTVLGTEANLETSYTKTLTVPEGTTGIMVILATGHTTVSTYCRIGGRDLTLLGKLSSNVYSLEGWLLDDTVGLPDFNMTWSGKAPYVSNYAASLVYIGGGTPSFNTWLASGSAACHIMTAPPIQNQIALGMGQSYSGARTHCSGQTAIITNTRNATAGYKVGTPAQALSVGMEGVSIAGVVAALSVYDGNPNYHIIPAPMALAVTMPAPTLTVDESVHSTVQSMGLKVTMPAPLTYVEVPRQIPLVGVDAQMPGRVPRPVGMTTPLLSDDGTKPYWIEAPAGPAGADGADGATWYDGSGVPDVGTGVEDDYYLERG